jgi:hypothetical protein
VTDEELNQGNISEAVYLANEVVEGAGPNAPEGVDVRAEELSGNQILGRGIL